ncbi:hypothetical protein HUJ04_001327 [Dendroctonus ponderosae]|uniref:BZIP domain-containing protein n=1 Tax=Dendroctonus ponderosae TaxID=77166 RepID=A0AAR5Q5G9_DENPD|nr:hypothetical protein HUJ04_001327 [Dendroctonus ponderosae]
MDQPLDLRVNRSPVDVGRVSNMMGNPYPMPIVPQVWTSQFITQPISNSNQPFNIRCWPCHQSSYSVQQPKYSPYEQGLPKEQIRPTLLEVTSAKFPKFDFQHVGNNFVNDDKMPNTLDRKRSAPERIGPRKFIGLSDYSMHSILSMGYSVDAENSFNCETGTRTSPKCRQASSSDSCESFELHNSIRGTVPQCSNITIIIDKKYMKDFEFADEQEHHLYLLAKKNPLLIVKMLDPKDAEAYRRFKQHYGDMTPRTKTNVNMRRKVPTKSPHSNDPDYTIKRLKNNESAKRSRDNRIAMSHEMELLDMFLKQTIEEKTRLLQTMSHAQHQPFVY